MSYRPPRQKSEFERGDRVIGKFRPVKIEGEKGVKVLWRTDEGEVRQKAVKLSNVFEDTRKDIIQVVKNDYEGEFVITFNVDGSSVVNFHPSNGQFKVKVSEFISAEDEPPKPKVYTGKYGDMVKFNVLLELTEPEALEGIEFVHQMFYEKFVSIENPETGETETGFSSPPGKSKHCDMLADFCDATGVWEFGAIPWSDNILPELERRIMRLEREFMVILNGGWVEHIYEIADYDADETDPVKEEMSWIEDDEEEAEPSEEEPQDEDDDEMFDWPDE